MNKLRGWFEQFEIFVSKGPTICAQFDLGMNNDVYDRCHLSPHLSERFDFQVGPTGVWESSP